MRGLQLSGLYHLLVGFELPPVTCVVSVADTETAPSDLPSHHLSHEYQSPLQTLIMEAKLDLQTKNRQDGEAGDGAEENIVYL